MSLVVGEVIAVSGIKISLRIFEDSNQESIFYNGVKYRGISIREHISIQRGFIDIVCLVEGEFLDERNVDAESGKAVYTRRVDVRPIGFIVDGVFQEGVKYMPMIRDVASLLSEPAVARIYGKEGRGDFSIGVMLKEDVAVNLPWARIFNGHLGIFGNTGSGKSNTLAKLYTTLFKQKHEILKDKSSFIIVDFNGEYTEDQILPLSEKRVTILNQKKPRDKLKLSSSHFWDVETLSLLFQATTNTQQPFIRRVVNGREMFKSSPDSLKNFFLKVFERAFSSGEAKPDALELSREIARIVDSQALQTHLKEIKYIFANRSFKSNNGPWYNSDGAGFTESILPILQRIDLDYLDQFDEFLLRAYLQLCSDVVLGYAQYEHIQPVLTRAKSSVTELRKVVELTGGHPPSDLLHVISLKRCKSDMKKILPLLIAKSIYAKHKDTVKSPPNKTLHLIIDEAHNILSEQSAREHEVWKDYRLELFEEIIKEGRKYGAYLTLSSQRPADISPTVVSQVHNFFIHRLVNDRDLKLLDNTISTLDTSSRALIPTLAKGCCVVTGTAFDLPMIIKVDPLLKAHRPSSDDVDLEDLWDDALI
ncbi:ATP-binding protein [Pseudomonas sp. BN102]|uniref:ATP-binding protein n=1 Tax=Pseudomonas sp. BN102 TaxID=2567886 RepID=UPI00245636B2|nr:ATP-binding protein [Pseudomonas sp. BN102]MDH4610316.1 ATP-binding protein [Pseudomonas sp. BN102]